MENYKMYLLFLEFNNYLNIMYWLFEQVKKLCELSGSILIAAQYKKIYCKTS